MASHGKNPPEYYRARRARLRAERAAQGNPMRVYADYDQTPHIIATGHELQRLIMEPLPDLPWPQSLYSDNPAAIGELITLDTKFGVRKVNAQDLCPCGKGHEHKHNVSQTIRSPYGNGWQVVYFHSEACKSAWNHARGGK